MGYIYKNTLYQTLYLKYNVLQRNNTFHVDEGVTLKDTVLLYYDVGIAYRVYRCIHDAFRWYLCTCPTVHSFGYGWGSVQVYRCTGTDCCGMLHSVCI